MFVKIVAGSFQQYTYMHNWWLQPFSQDYDLGSHITYVVCVVLYAWVSGSIVYNEKFFITIILFTLRVFARNLPKKYFNMVYEHFFLTSNKSTHYQLYYGDILIHISSVNINIIHSFYMVPHSCWQQEGT